MDIEAAVAAARQEGARHKELVEALEARWGIRNGEEIRGTAELLWLLEDLRTATTKKYLETILRHLSLGIMKTFSDSWQDRNGGESVVLSPKWAAIEEEIFGIVKNLYDSKRAVFGAAGIL